MEMMNKDENKSNKHKQCKWTRNNNDNGNKISIKVKTQWNESTDQNNDIKIEID